MKERQITMEDIEAALDDRGVIAPYPEEGPEAFRVYSRAASKPIMVGIIEDHPDETYVMTVMNWEV